MDASLQSAELFRLVIENARDYAIFTVDEENRITTWNSGAERLLGWREEEAVGQSASMIFTPEDRAAHAPEKELATARADGRAEDLRWHLRQNGSRFWGSGIMFRLDATGSPAGFAKILRDMTAQKEVEEVLRASEERFRRALEIETVGVIFFDPAGEITGANDAFLRMGGYTRDDLEARRLRWDKLTPPEWIPASLRALEELKTTGSTTPYEKEYYATDGSRWWGLFAAKRLSETEGVEFILDISERKRSEEALRASDERFRTLVQNIRDYAIFMLDENGIITEWTEGAQRVTGYKAEEVVGRHLAMLYIPEDAAAGVPNRELAEAAEHGRAEREVWQIRKGGDRYWVNEIATAVHDADGTLLGFTKISRDLTERKRSEVAQRSMNETLERRVRERTQQVRTLASALALAEQKERRRVAQLLHDDLQQVLFSARMKLQALRIDLSEGRVDTLEETTGQVEEILDAAIQTARLVTVELSPPILVEEGLTAAIRWLAGQMKRMYRLNVEVRSDADGEPNDTDMRAFLFQMARELLFNVVKHAGTREAQVDLSLVDGQVTLTVTDDGSGFDPDVVAEGTQPGFGLLSIRERVDIFDGTLDIRSSPEEGTRVSITVPLREGGGDLS